MVDYNQILDQLYSLLVVLEDEGDELKLHNLNQDIDALEAYMNSQISEAPDLSKWGFKKDEVLEEKLVEHLNGETSDALPGEDVEEDQPKAGLEDEIQQEDQIETDEPEQAEIAPPEIDRGSEPTKQIGELQETYQRLSQVLRSSTTDDREINRALEQIKAILSSGALTDQTEINQWKTLGDQFNIEKARRRNRYYNAGIAYVDNEDFEKAREMFSKIISLDPEDQSAKEQLVELNRNVAEKISESEYRILENKLKSEKNLKVLTKAVQEAETLYQQGKLPEKLVQLYFDAIEMRDSIRATHGIITTKARIGNLQQAYDAAVAVEEAIKSGQSYWHDEESGEDIPISEFLEKANLFWQDRSLEFYNSTAIAVQNNLDSHQPDVALNIFNNRRIIKETGEEQRIHESHKDNWAKLEQTILEEKEKQDQAKQLILESEQASDTIIGFRKLYSAKTVFPFLPGIDERLADARSSALAYLLPQFNNILNAIEGDIDSFNFDQIEAHVTKGAALQSLWPESAIPEEIKEKVDQILSLAERGQKKAELYRQFREKLKNIESLIDIGELMQAKEAINELEDDPEFGVSNYQIQYENTKRNLLARMAKEADVAAKVKLAEEAKIDLEWDSVLDIVQGEKDPELVRLFNEARYHLWVSELDQCIKDQNVDKAEELYDSILQEYPDSAEALIKQQQFISDGKENTTDAIRTLYKRAVRLAQSPQIVEKSEALKIFESLAGFDHYRDEQDETQLSHSVTSLTFPAREQMEDLQKALRDNYIPIIVNGAKTINDLDSTKKETLARIAEELRTSNLLWMDEEKQAAKTLELNYKLEVAQALKKSGAWEEVFQILQEVDRHYPRTPQVKYELREARLEHALDSARALVGAGNAEQGLEVLKVALSSESLQNSIEIRFEMINIYDLLEDYDAALHTLQVLDTPEYDEDDRQNVRALMVEYGKKRVVKHLVDQTLESLNRLEKDQCWELPEHIADDRNETPRDEIYAILQDLWATKQEVTSERLDVLFNDLFFKEENYLLREESHYLSVGTPETKYKALLAMIDLERIENIRKDQVSAGVAEQKIQEIIADIDVWVIHLLAPAKKCMPGVGNIPVPINTMYQMVTGEREKLQIVQKYVDKEWINMQLDKQIKALANVQFEISTLQADEEVKTFVLDDSLNSNWAEYVSSNDFSRLELLKQRLEAALIPEITEIETFYQRLVECRNLSTYFHDGIREIKKLYMPQNGEHYDCVVEIIQTLKLFEGYEKYEHLREVREEDYHQIFSWLDTRMNIATLKIKLNGWDTVLIDAKNRQENFLIWRDWYASIQRECEAPWIFQDFVETCIDSRIPWINEDHRQKLDHVNGKELMPDYLAWMEYLLMPGMDNYFIQNPDMAKFRFLIPANHPLPLTYQKWTWLENYRFVLRALYPLASGPDENVEDRIQEMENYISKALGLYRYQPGDNDEYIFAKRRIGAQNELHELSSLLEIEDHLSGYETLSEKATEIKEHALKLFNELTDKANKTMAKLKSIQKSIDGYSGFPLPAEGKNAITNPVDLKQNIIDRAIMIGVAAPDEAQQLNFWTNKYKALVVNNKKKGR